MEDNTSLQQIVENAQVNETPIVLDYARVKNKTNWKKVVIYGSIIGAAGTATSLYLLNELSKYVDKSIGKTLEIIMNY